VDEVLLIDDASKDRTSQIAERLGISVIKHERNQGYGGNQKTCYDNALERGADVVVMVHPDYQYDPRVIPFAWDSSRRGSVTSSSDRGSGRAAKPSKAACRFINTSPTAS